MILNVNHRTLYHYSEAILRSFQLIRLTPLNNSRQQVLNWSLVTSAGILVQNQDCFANVVHCLTLKSIRQIEIIASGRVEVFPAAANPQQGSLPLEYYLRTSELTAIAPEMREFVERVAAQPRSALNGNSAKFQFLLDLSREILRELPYTPGVTDSSTTASQAFMLKSGVCQDHAHVFIALVRAMNIPVRYVSGYLHTDDASHLASHAWAEAWLDDAWYSFDISNQCAAGEQHIELAYGLDYLDAAPIRGSRIGGGTEELEVISLVRDREQ